MFWGLNLFLLRISMITIRWSITEAQGDISEESPGSALKSLWAYLGENYGQSSSCSVEICDQISTPVLRFLLLCRSEVLERFLQQIQGIPRGTTLCTIEQQFCWSSFILSCKQISVVYCGVRLDRTPRSNFKICLALNLHLSEAKVCTHLKVIAWTFLEIIQQICLHVTFLTVGPEYWRLAKHQDRGCFQCILCVNFWSEVMAV